MVIFVVILYRFDSIVSDLIHEYVGAYSSLSKAIEKADEYINDDGDALYFPKTYVEIVRFELDNDKTDASFCMLETAKSILKRNDEHTKWFRGEKEE